MLDQESIRAVKDGLGDLCASGVVEKDRQIPQVGPVHYNTLEEIRRFGGALGKIAAGVA